MNNNNAGMHFVRWNNYAARHDLKMYDQTEAQKNESGEQFAIDYYTNYWKENGYEEYAWFSPETMITVNLLLFSLEKKANILKVLSISNEEYEKKIWAYSL